MLAGGKLPPECAHSENVSYQPFMQPEQLPELLGKHQFYIQVSMTEGFPNALIEAMACGCVPIVSQVGVMPEIIGDTGYILESKDPQLLEKLIRKAIAEYTPMKALAARARATQYSIERRTDVLLETLSSMDNKN